MRCVHRCLIRKSFAALTEGADLLIDDGRLRLKVEKVGKDFAETRVITGGQLSDRKDVNVPGVVLPLSALTEKDRADLDYQLVDKQTHAWSLRPSVVARR